MEEPIPNPNSLKIIVQKYKDVMKERIVKRVQITIPGEDKFVAAYFQIGEGLFILEKYQEVIRNYKKAILSWSDLPGAGKIAAAYFQIGNAYVMLKRRLDAIKNYKKAIFYRSRFPEVSYNMGNAKLYLKQYYEAIKDYTRVIAVKPDYIEAYYNRAVAISQLGYYPEREVLEELIKIIEICDDSVIYDRLFINVNIVLENECGSAVNGSPYYPFLKEVREKLFSQIELVPYPSADPEFIILPKEEQEKKS